MDRRGELDPQAKALLEMAAAAHALPLWSLPVDTARARMKAAFLGHGPGPDVFEVTNIVIPGPAGGCPARLYRARAHGEPLVLFMHGGGGVINDVDTHDRLCRLIAMNGDVSLISIDYRLAPEFTYPAALDDAIRAWVYCCHHAGDLRVSPEGLGVMGDSSGATLAFGVSALCVDLQLRKPDVQCLLYPVADHYAAGYPSYASNGTGYSLDAATMKWFLDHFIGKTWSPVDGYLFPLRRKDFRGFPRTVLSTAEFDPLRDEGRELGRRLEEASVTVDWHEANGQMHGFAMQTKNIQAAMKHVESMASLVGRILHRSG